MDIIDADECAQMLKCSVEQVEESCREGELPGFKQGRGWLFVRADLLSWLAEKARKEAAERKAQRTAQAAGKLTRLTEAVKPRRKAPPALPVAP